ncbi:MAG TPA: glycosyltransferase [Candidatus Eisenbacteria bacterium]|nr:glycosyltransferase [Candidatus Eisenbacteria bacterium]
MPAVSVIMNVRNGGATLRAALQSVMAQTFSDWEVIVWDDRSTDESARVVAEFVDPRIRYSLAPVETSLGQARDAAIRHARGDWLAFLDQDDLWLAHKLELQLALGNERQVGLIYGRTLCFYPNGSLRDYDYFHEFTPLPEGGILAELLGRGCFIAMSSVLLRRSAIYEVGGIPPHIQVTPDYFLYLSVCGNYSARAVQEVVAHYRIHPASMTKTYRRESLEETLRLVDDWRSHLSPAAYARRRVRIATTLALEEMLLPGERGRGIRRLLTDGSLVWLVSRPCIHMWRLIRRRLRRPYWKKSAKG